MRSFLILLLGISFNSFAQEDYFLFTDLHYRNQIENAPLYLTDKAIIHSSVKPMLVNVFQPTSGRKTINLLDTVQVNKVSPKSRYNHFWVHPIVDMMGGGAQSSDFLPTYHLGAGINLNYSRKKLFFTCKVMPFLNESGYVADSLQKNYQVDPGSIRPFFSDLFWQGEIYAAYKPNHIFTLIGGVGKNFFGEGYRSLLYSDNAGSNPFFKIETTFGNIKYVNLYSMWKDNTEDPFNRNLDQTKFTASHYLSWNITRDINLSIFETVIWQARDTLNNRNFDFNYINPIVFYRPVEYSLGSSDNVLLGLNLTGKISRHHNVYYQLVVDEFLKNNLLSSNKWWANKWGMQLGFKSDQFLIDQLYFQIEYNGVRPFTYSHAKPIHAYGHLNSPIAHPLGANFHEMVQIFSYKKNEWRFTNKITYQSYGSDHTDSISYGQNIFKPYSLREGDYGHHLAQGNRTNVLNETFIVEYPFKWLQNTYITGVYNWRFASFNGVPNHEHTLMIGIRSRIWNRYTDF